MINRSPWLEILDKNRKVHKLSESITTDILVVGGGIAGVVTAYYLLQETDKKIVLLEADRIAHGATGHNAGHVTTSFEAPIHHLVSRFGEQVVKKSLEAMETVWETIEHILSNTNLKVHYSSFIGYGGYPTIELLLVELENIRQLQLWGVIPGKVLVHEQYFHDIPDNLKEFCEHVSKDRINDVLKVKKESQYVAAIPQKMAVMNSAHFTEELLKWCLGNYSERFTVFEESPMSALDALLDHTIAHVDDYTITAESTVLCTNGFEHFKIQNEGYDIDTRFHHEINGYIGYMTGYVRKDIYEPGAHWFMQTGANFSQKKSKNDPYFYMTRRPYFHNHSEGVGLLAVGGPEVELSERLHYDKKKALDASIKKELTDFIHHTVVEEAELKPEFFWHGLMGYTTSGVRLIGPDPCNKRILYNLGCNGIGITPSILGGTRIAQFINGEKIEPLMFDPADSRCAVSAPPEYLTHSNDVMS